MRNTYNLAILGLLAVSAFVTASGQQGAMHGGQQPIVGGRIYVLTPAQSATPGTASVSLLTSGDGSDSIGFYVLTQPVTGNFQVTPYNCPSPNAPIYIYASGGDAQTGAGANAAISEAVYVGPCDVASQAHVFLNEVTTVAMAYALAGYATDPRHISYSGSQASLTGIENAFANASNLADSASGYANSTIPSGYASAPEKTVNTLANALAGCINETSQTPNTSNCAILFSATSVSGVPPTDTATAVMNIAHNPASSTSPGIQNGTNITSIMTLAQAYEQFAPMLTSAPSDLTLGLTFTDSDFGNPAALAIDGSGNAWIASQTSSSLPAGSVVEIANPTSMLANNVTYPVNYTPKSTEPDSIAVDAASQNIWIGTDTAVEEFSTNTGAPVSGSPFLEQDPDFMGGYALNLDSTGNVWIAAWSTIYELSAAGSVISSPGGYGLPAGTSATPTALALDSSDNVWVTDQYSNALVELNSQGTWFQNIGPANNPDLLSSPFGVAIDASKDVWVANNGNNNDVEYIPSQQTSLVYVSPDTPPATSNGTPPTLTFVAIDGAGNSWSSLQDGACNSNNSVCLGVAETSGAGKQLSGPGYSISHNGGGDPTASATAIDGSGNVWILNKYAQSVTELVGAAAPVVTPLALAVSSNSLGVRP